MFRRRHHTVLKSFHVFLRTNVVYTSRLPCTKPRYRSLSTGSAPISTKRPSVNPWILYPATGLLLGGAGYWYALTGDINGLMCCQPPG
ncbi:hypothetical protein J3R82DRAFT_10634 [Butyriboletus roseoflavus]|nr:hypothetical protein J3R82DRAFT_10634 [Butyriboletus roseoflavus]